MWRRGPDAASREIAFVDNMQLGGVHDRTFQTSQSKIPP
jgi:hypothetical protein